jgi:hypothetical protein
MLILGITYKAQEKQRKTIVHIDDAVLHPWLGIPVFGSNFWDPHWKQNSNSIFDSGDSGRIIFEIPISGKSENQNSDLQNSEFR